MSHDYELLIRESHLDSFGHVNNAAYLTLFEEARWQMITERGYDLQKVHNSRQGPVILDLTLKFIQEIRLRETIRITTKLLTYEKKVGTLEQKMLKTDGTVCAEAKFTFGLFDLDQRKLILPTEEWKKAVGLT